MAVSIAVAGASTTVASVSFRNTKVALRGSSALNSVSHFHNRRSFPSLRMHSGRFHISCAAKPETVEKVAHIVKKQLALPDGSSVTGESKFAALGADSLDTVEIVMGLEEEFGISVEEERAQSIATVQDAADLIEDLIAKKDA